MKKSAATVLLCLLLAGLTLLSACQTPGGPGNGTDTEPSTPAETLPWEDAGVLIADGKTAFTIVRSDKCSEYVKKQASLLRNGLVELCPDFPITTDWERDMENKAEEIAARYEILLGLTNRPQSASAAEGLPNDSYRVVRDGTKIVLAAGSFAALEKAVRAFLASLRTEGDAVIFDTDLSGKASSSYLIAVTDQKNSRVSVFDLAAGDLSAAKAVWSHSYSEYNIADTRLREYEGKDVVLAAYGGSSASMTDVETGKVLWSTNQTANNPHAAELIPTDGGYVIAVAASTGNEIRFFALPSVTPAASVSFPDAHGALWDPLNGLLWAQGDGTLTAYTVRRNGNTVTVTEAEEHRSSLPSGGAHDLQPYYGDPDKLFVTNSKAVYVYSKSQKTFSTDYPGWKQLNRANVKGVGIFPDGSLIYIVPDGAFRTWTSATVNFVQNIGGDYVPAPLTSPDSGYYKVRVWNKNYQ